MKNLNHDPKAQSTIEFTFAMVAIIFLIFGMLRVFRWAGMDLANRRVNQDLSLTGNISTSGDPSPQLDPGDNPVLPMGTVYNGSITENIN